MPSRQRSARRAPGATKAGTNAGIEGRVADRARGCHAGRGARADRRVVGAPAPTAERGNRQAETPDRRREAAPQRFAVHGQATIVGQGNTRFRAPYEGANSLRRTGDVRETFDATLYVGVSPWRGLELWADPEIDQGFGLRNTLGAAGFPSAEAYKVGKKNAVFPPAAAVLRGRRSTSAATSRRSSPTSTCSARRHTADRLTITIGKFGVGDIFDQNKYAHDPRGDFLNWTAVDLGTFDYAADAWGYTYGGAVELAVGAGPAASACSTCRKCRTTNRSKSACGSIR